MCRQQGESERKKDFLQVDGLSIEEAAGSGWPGAYMDFPFDGRTGNYLYRNKKMDKRQKNEESELIRITSHDIRNKMDLSGK